MHNFHPIVDIFPMMPEAELAKLAEDIRANGQREPIWVDQEGRIIDGRNRFLACQQVGVEPAYRTYEGDDIAGFVWSLNRVRRHLTEGQIGLAAAKLANITHGMNQHTMEDGSKEPSISIAEAAEKFGTSVATVKRAKTVLQDGTPEEIKAVETGETAVTPTAKAIRQRKKSAETEPPAAKVSSGPRARVSVPKGMTLEEWTREIMRCVDRGQTPEEAASDAHMNTDTFRKARDIVLLADRDDLSQSDTDKAKAALAGMNETQQVRNYHEQMMPIIERIWGKSRHGVRRDERTEKRRREEFERGFGHLTTACAFAERMEIPHLPEDRRKQALEELQECQRHLTNLKKRIEE